ncbi:acyl-CoA dehydrogenase family protein [Nocardioides sp. L-11A]|uniref:acyl-CoA dehydrogenase family protein n=1 Tax=Nocardioides sp. L-11A TaxID=3043848 RepID=UPI00249BEC4A|nr:acyl-CoA dehydrogenase family protein [Nocardioides sp. L-11A]
MIPLDEFCAEAEAFLAGSGLARRTDEEKVVWGEGELDVSVFHDLGFAEESALIEELKDWQRRKFQAGFGAITWEPEYGGRGLAAEYLDAYDELELRYRTPRPHETFSVTQHLIAPTVRLFGTDAMRADLVPAFLRGEQICCQLFSEPSAGSDLAALGTRAVREDDAWVVNGQKVWSSGAQFADWGELICRTDPTLPKHAGMTAFMIPMDWPGVEVRPLRQMSGGTSFNEVFLTDVRLPDEYRIGEVGQGWEVALTTLGFERQAANNNAHVGGNWRQLLAAAQWAGVLDDPFVRQDLARAMVSERLGAVAVARDQAARESGRPMGAIGSVRMMQWVGRMLDVTAAARRILGPRLVVDDGEWGTYVWGQHVLGAPGYRIAGGSDEIQRTIIAERWLGMPPEPRADKDTPWKDLPR